MAQPEIVDVGEIIAELGIGSTVPNADRALLTSLKGRVENLCRRQVKHGITQPASPYYVEYHPRANGYVSGDGCMYELSGGMVVQSNSGATGLIQLDNPFVRSISEVREDFSAHFGQAGDFPSSSILAADVYALEVDTQLRDGTALSKSGILRRRTGNWASRAGTVKVTYIAGFTAAELDDEFSDIKDAVIQEVVTRFKLAKSRSGATGAGVYPLKSESIGGQYSYTQDTSVAIGLSSATSNQLMKTTQDVLAPYVRWSP